MSSDEIKVSQRSKLVTTSSHSLLCYLAPRALYVSDDYLDGSFGSESMVLAGLGSDSGSYRIQAVRELSTLLQTEVPESSSS